MDEYFSWQDFHCCWESLECQKNAFVFTLPKQRMYWGNIWSTLPTIIFWNLGFSLQPVDKCWVPSSCGNISLLSPLRSYICPICAFFWREEIDVGAHPRVDASHYYLLVAQAQEGNPPSPSSTPLRLFSRKKLISCRGLALSLAQSSRSCFSGDLKAAALDHHLISSGF